jgi:SAM-dependent methyltransferase
MATVAQVEKYWDQRPCNIRHSNANPGSYEWSHDVTVRKYFVEPHIPRFANFAAWKGAQVLEIGCGIGTDTLEFLRAGVKRIDAVDVSAQSLILARKRAQYEAFKGTYTFWHANAEDWLPGGPFDLVYAFGVLHHTPHPERVLERARARMNPGAALRVMIYAHWSLKRITRQQPEAQAGCPIAKTYSSHEVRELIEKAGFRVLNIEKTHIFPYRVDDYIEHRYVKHWPYRVMPAAMFAWLERKLGWHLLVTARKA